MANKKVIFQLEWMDPKINPEWFEWLRPVESDSNRAFCKICNKSFSLSNMGRQAVISHAGYAKHVKQKELLKTNVGINRFFTTEIAGPSTSSAVPILPENMPSISIVDDSQASPVTVSKKTSSSSNPFVIKDDTTKAEVLWALKCVMNRFSYSSCENISDCFFAMFPDSEIARQFTLGRTKVSYIISFGLAPYFTEQLFRNIQKCSKIVICFDEAFNKISQKCQMDLLVRFWNDEVHQIETRYLNSVFLGHQSATDLVAAFKSGLCGIDIRKVLQVSMDGPNVNWKFLDILKEDIQLDNKDPGLLEIGCCGLHVIHGAFQTGHKASGWKLNSVLHAFYYLFKDSPARRADFTELTGSTIFAKKFCGHRWLENSEVVDRVISMIPFMRIYVQQVPKKPIVGSFEVVSDACKHVFFEAKLEFFKSVTIQLEPFLKKFQTSKPVAPFLYHELSNLLRSLLSRIVKVQVMVSADTAKKLMAIKLNKSSDALKAVKDVDIGFGARRTFPKKCSELEKYTFYENCQAFLIATVAKIIERCPLNYKMIRAISSIQPSLISSSNNLAVSRMDTCLQSLLELNQISSTTADKVKQQFGSLSISSDCISAAKNFNENEDRLDSFWFKLIGGEDKFTDLFSVVKFILILSHGNASVESGFSINEDMLVENLKEKSLIAMRSVYDAVISEGGILKVKINKDLLKSVRQANSRYKQALEDQRKNVECTEFARNNRKKLLDEVKHLEAKKRKLEESSTAEKKLIEMQIVEIKKTL